MVLETLDRSAPSDPGVYAMGAGVLHIQVAHGRACHEGGDGRLRHDGLDRPRRRRHQPLRPPQEHPVQERHPARRRPEVRDHGHHRQELQLRGALPGLPGAQPRSAGPTQHIASLKVCSSSTASATWPSALDAKPHIRPAPKYQSRVRSTYTSFNQIPQRTVDFPATTGPCIPSAVPATPSAANGVRLAPTGHGRMTVSWNKPAASPRATSVQVQLSEYHPSTRTWDYSQNEQYRTIAPTTCHYAFTGLVSNHLYRATVVLRNGAGFGLSDGSGDSALGRATREAGLPARLRHPRAQVGEPALQVGPAEGVRPARDRLPGAGPAALPAPRLRVVGASLSSRRVSWYRPHVRKHARYQLRVRATYHGGVTAYRYHRMYT